MGRAVRTRARGGARWTGSRRPSAQPPRVLWDDGGRALATARRCRCSRARLGVVDRRLGPRAPAPACCRVGRSGRLCRAARRAAHRAGARPGRSGHPHRRRGHGPVRPARSRRGGEGLVPVAGAGLAPPPDPTRASALALVAPALRDWAADSGGVDPVRYTALHVADDLSYGAGVWLGCARERTLGPVVPRISWRARVWSARSLRENLSGGVTPADGRDQPSRRALQTSDR